MLVKLPIRQGFEKVEWGSRTRLACEQCYIVSQMAMAPISNGKTASELRAIKT